MPRGARPGERRGGRKKGTPNKLSLTVRETVIETFKQIGDVPGFVAWAKENQDKFYLIYAKLLPPESGHNTHVNVNVLNPADLAQLSDAELGRRIAALEAGTLPAGEGESRLRRVPGALPA